MYTIAELKKGSSQKNNFYHKCYLNGYVTKEERDKLIDENNQRLEAIRFLVDAQKQMFGKEVTE